MGAIEQQIADALIDMALDLLRADASTQAEVIRVLRRMEFELRELLGRDGLSAVTKARLRALLAQAATTIDRFYAIASGANQIAIAGIADIQARQVGRILGMVVATEPTLPNATMLARIVSNALIEGAPSSEWWGRQSLDVAWRFQNQLRQGITQGETNEQIVARIVGNDTHAGVMPIARSNARALVHTSIQAVANAARLNTFRRNADIVECLVWLATLDSHTCLACASRDLKQYSLADQEPLDGGPPWDAGPGAIHWSCRCVISIKPKPLPGAPHLPEGERASTTGPVAGNTRFAEYLERRGEAFQDEVLGRGRAQLWRQGKLTLEQLLDPAALKPLTLDELRKKYGLTK